MTTWNPVEADEHHGEYIEDSEGQTVCDLYFKDGHGLHIFPNAEANARLIAAAPGILTALGLVADEMLESCRVVDVYIVKALAKALL